MADSAQPQDSSVLPSWVHLDSNSWDILDAIFSSVTATVVCVFMTALFVHLSGYSRLWRDSGLHWSERARRLLPLRSVILLTVSLAIFLQPIECYFFLRDGVDIDWLPTIVVILWIVSYIAYILIYTFSNLGSIRIRTTKERLYDTILVQLIYGSSVYYVIMIIDLVISMSDSLTVDLVLIAIGFVLLLAIHFGASLKLAEWLGVLERPTSELEANCFNLAERLKLKRRPRILVANWTHINALAFPLANVIVLPTELFRFLREDQVLAIVGHEFGHLMESVMQKLTRLRGSFVALIIFTVPIIVITIPLENASSISVGCSAIFSLLGISIIVYRLVNEGFRALSIQKLMAVIACSIINSVLLYQYFAILRFQAFAHPEDMDDQGFTFGDAKFDQFVLFGFITGFFCFLAAISPGKNRAKIEVAADQVGVEAEQSPGVYAQALLKLYEVNLIPAVMLAKPRTHPALYDRLLASGMTPDFPRPDPPRFGMTRLFSGALVILHPAIFYASVYSINSEVTFLRLSH